MFQVNYLNDFLPKRISLLLARNRDANQSKNQLSQYFRCGAAQ